MKKRIRKTGEIVDVISFTAPFGVTREDTRDFVSYIDSKGRERVKAPMNIYWDFEDMEEVLKTDIDFEQRRYEIAKELMKAFASNPHGQCVDASVTCLARWSVEGADALIAELKKGGAHEKAEESKSLL